MVTQRDIVDAIYEMVGECGSVLRPDLLAAIERAHLTERSETGRRILAMILKNAEIARTDDVPICQDTGTVWVRIETGEDEPLYMEGSVQAAIDRAVAAAYRDNGLRMSMVHDALLDRSNTGTNTPAFVEVVQRPGVGVTVHVMMKGAGSDNASRIVMLSPDEGLAGIERVLLETVHEKGSVACPPMVIGVGVGSTIDKVGGLAKRALLRSIGEPNPNPKLAEIEEHLLCAVNRSGIGPGGLGGDTTALAVHVLSAPSHIAAFPVAVNLGCSAHRWRTRELS